MNLTQRRKRPEARLIIDAGKLRLFRQRAQLSLNDVAELTGIGKSTISDYEHGHIVPQLHQFKKLCEAYELDILEILALLHLRILDPRTVRDFRRACRVEGVIPAQALRDFLLVYAYK